MLSVAEPVRRPMLVVSLLVLLAPAAARAQASGVLQATVRVVQSQRPAEQALLEHGSALTLPGDSVTVDPASSSARVELLALPDSQPGRASMVRPHAIRATVTYLR
jgi:hypothetical protein